MIRDTTRTGPRTSVTADPRNIEDQIVGELRKANPSRFPLVALGQKIMKGPSPKNFKIWSRQFDRFDPWDTVSNVVLGSSVGPSYETMALLTVSQATRPDLTNKMLYSPQERLIIAPTMQEVEVIMTPTSSIRISNGYTTNDYLHGLPVGLTGNTDARTAPGTVLVKTLRGVPFKPFTRGDILYANYVSHELQPWEATPRHSDTIYTCQYVERIEGAVSISEDMNGWLKRGQKFTDHGTLSHMIAETKELMHNGIETQAIFGEGSYQPTYEKSTKTNSWGLIPQMKTHVTYFNPDTLDFESVVNSWLFEHAYETVVGDPHAKLFLCGEQFMFKFNNAMREFRSVSREGVLKQKIGLNVAEYNIMGYDMKLIPYQLFKRGTPFENWCLCIDPTLAKLCVVDGKDFYIKSLSRSDERELRYGIEWLGCYLWEFERAHALLRTAI